MNRKENKKTTFIHDPKVHCEHIWCNSHGHPRLLKCERPEYDRVCDRCGAGATWGDVPGLGQRVVAFDREWDFGWLQTNSNKKQEHDGNFIDTLNEVSVRAGFDDDFAWVMDGDE